MTTLQIPASAIDLYNDMLPVLNEYTHGDLVWAFGIILNNLYREEGATPEIMDTVLQKLKAMMEAEMQEALLQ
jgi:hypothetical protein